MPDNSTISEAISRHEAQVSHGWAASITLGILALAGLYIASLYNYLLFHSLAEGFSIVVACGVFMLAWNSRKMVSNDYLLFLGIAYLFVAAIDLVHTLGYSGMNIFSGYDTNLPTQLWIAARYTEALTLLIAPLFFTRRLKPVLVLSVYAVLTAVLLTAVFSGIFPDCFIEGQGLTLCKKISEYIISILLVFSGLILYTKRKSINRNVFRLMIFSIGLTIASEMSFTFYIHAYGFSNLVGHFLKIVSFYLIYKAIIQTGLVKPYDLLFRDLKKSEQSLERRVQERTRELEQANENMEHLNAVLRAIRNVNQLITRERDRDTLLQEACDKLIETRGYGFAWIALFDESGSFQKAVHAGLDEEFKGLYSLMKDGPLPACCRHAYETPDIVSVTDEIREECDRCPLKEKCIGKTELAIRLEFNKKTFGVLSISLPENFSKLDQELSLFQEVAGDIAFALYNIGEEEEHGTTRHALSVEEERYRDLVETTDDLVQSVAPDGSIIFVNRAWEKALGYTEKDLAGISIFDIIHEDSREHCMEIFKQVMSGKKTDNLEAKFKAKDGRTVIVEGSASCRIENGKPVVTYGIFHDITDLKSAEKQKQNLQNQLLQSQKMEAIGNLAGGVAHDFNNILTVIKGNTELGLMKLDKGNPLYPDMTQVKEAADRAANLTRQLLIYGRRQPMDFAQLDINKTIKNLLKMLKRLIGEDIDIDTDFEEPLWPVKADPGNIEQVIMNLSVNARDAMPDGGTLTFNTKNIKIDDSYVCMNRYARTGRFVCLSIEDSGTGMDKETQEHIFEPFFTTKGVGEGTGLGMSVVYGIIKEHKGWINVYSEPGKGTTFKIYLPASFTREKVKPITKDIAKSVHGKGERILLVEDEETVLATTKKMLEEMGYSITAAGTAKEATEVFEKEKGSFDLLFTDTILPDTNGIELIDQLKEKKPDLKVLLSSGYAGAKVQRDIIQERRFPFVQKPYDMTELLALINQILKQESQT